MPAAASNIVNLRRMLADRFPAAHRTQRAPAPDGISTGVPALDSVLGGGLPRGEITELVGESHGSGSGQVIHTLLEHTAGEGRFLALVDGADSFDVDAPAAGALTRLLWIRCRAADEALKAADLLLRDRNFPLVVLDLKLNPLAQLRKVPSSVWHRFGRLAEFNGTTLLVVTPWPLVGAVTVRVEARADLGIEAMARTPAELTAALHFELWRADTVGIGRRSG